VKSFLIFISFLLSSCASITTVEPISIYESISSSLEINEEVSKTVFLDAQPVDLSIEHMFELSSTDKLFEYQGLAAHYDMYSIEIQNPGNYALDVYSKGTISGKVLYPGVKWFGPDLQEVHLSNVNFYARQTGVSTAGKYIGTSMFAFIEIQIAKPGTYYLLVTSDNNNLGESVLSYHSRSFGSAAGYDFQIDQTKSLVKHPYGTYLFHMSVKN
jgi:hypothetical protein